LDQHLSNDIWCEEDDFAYYDYQLLRRVMNNLRTCRESGNIDDLKGALEACIKANFGNVPFPQTLMQFPSWHRESEAL